MAWSFTDGSGMTGGFAYRMNQALKDLVKWRDKFTCQLCGKQYPDVVIEVDHIIPHACGGLSVPDNLRVLCLKCNRATRRTQYNARLPADEYYALLELELKGVCHIGGCMRR